MSETTGGIHVPVTSDVSQLVGALKQASAAVSDFASKTVSKQTAISSSIKKMAGNYRKFISEVLTALGQIPTNSKVTQKAIDELAAKVKLDGKVMSDAFVGVSGQVTKLNAPVRALGAAFDEVGAKAGAASTKVSSFGTATQTAGGKAGFFTTMIKRIASAAGVLIVFALARAVAGIISFSAEFEAGLTKIVALVGVTREKVKQWAAEMPAIARITAKGMDELGDSLYYITSAGIRGAKETTEALKNIAAASSAGLGDMTSVARTVVSAVNAWGKENLSTAEATSVLLNTVKEGNLRTEELAGSFAKVIPIASALGVSMKEVGASIAFLSRSGMNAATATTGLRRLMLALSAPSKEAEVVLNDIGISAEFLREKLQGPNGLQDAIRYLAMATEQDFAKIEAAIPSIRALGPALTLARGSMTDFIDVFNSLNETNPQDAMQAMMESIGDTKRLTSELSAEWSILKTTLGDTGVWRAVVFGIKETIGWIGDLVVAIGKLRKEHLQNRELDYMGSMLFGAVGIGNFEERLFAIRDLLIEAKTRGLDLDDILARAPERVKNQREELHRINKELGIQTATVREGMEEAQRLQEYMYEAYLRVMAGDEVDRLAEENKRRRLAREKEIAEAREAATKDAAEAMRRANWLIDEEIKKGAGLLQLWMKFPAEMSLITRKGKDLTTTLKKIAAETEKSRKETERSKEAREKEIETIDKAVTSFLQYADVLAKTNPELADLLENQSDLLIAMVASGATINEVREAINGYKGEVKLAKDRVKDLQDQLKVIVERFNEAKKSVEGLSSALSDIVARNYSDSLYAMLTGDFDSLVEMYKTFGEDVASALADGLADVFSYDFEGELNDYLAGLKLKDPEAWDVLNKAVNIAGGIAGAYGMYETMRSEGMSTGQGALAGAALGAQIGSAFPGYGTAIGAAIGAIAGAIMANAISKSQDQFWIDVGSQYEGGSYVTETDLPDETINKFQDDMMAIIRVTQNGLMDIAGLFASEELFAGLNEAFKNLTFMVGGRTSDMQALMDTILSDEVPAYVLRSARASFAKAFKDIGFAKLFRGAWAQMMELPGDEALAMFEKIAAGAIALSEAIEKVSFEDLIDELDLSAWETFEKRMTDSFSQIDALYEKMIHQLDLGAAADDAYAIAQLIEDARAAELQMLQQIKQAQEAINSGWDNISRQLDLYDRSDYKKMEYFSYELTDALRLLQDAVSPEEIQKYSGDMQTAFQNMMGLVEEGDWDKRFADWKFNDPVGRAFLDIEGLNELLGFDVNAFEGTTREFFQALMEALRGETDDAFEDAYARVAEWADALEDAALRAAEALNNLAIVLTDDDDTDTPKVLSDNITDPIVVSMEDIAASNMEVQNRMLESAFRTHDLLQEVVINPPSVTIDIDGTLDPLIALIDARIQTAGGHP